jgi:hypothetical protein
VISKKFLRACLKNYFLRRRRYEKIARRETSGYGRYSVAPPAREILSDLFQTFYIWLLSFCRFAAQTVLFKHALSLLLSCVLITLFHAHATAAEENPLAKFSKILPEKVGVFRKGKSEIINEPLFSKNPKELTKEDFGLISRSYTRFMNSARELEIGVVIEQTSSELNAYSLLTYTQRGFSFSSEYFQKCGYGLVCIQGDYRLSNELFFIKGNTLVSIRRDDKKKSDFIPADDKDLKDAISSLAKLIDSNLEKGTEDDIPSLVKHLPNWETAKDVWYALSLNVLKYAINNQSQIVFDSIMFEPGTEAVVANYDKAKLAIVEYPTPQMASDADQRILQKINELKSQNQLVPTAYKRVGNYSVFVFDAPDETTANNLISQVEYGKTVQWLSGDPYEYERANRHYLMTAGSIIVTVLKTSGLALLVCFAIGGGFGYFVFVRRRRQQMQTTAFSDAGGMIRLNLDEMTPQTEPSRLLNKASD